MNKTKHKTRKSLTNLCYGFILILKCSPLSMVKLVCVNITLGIATPLSLYLSQLFIDSLVDSIRQSALQIQTIKYLILCGLMIVFHLFISEYNSLLMQSLSDKSSLKITNILLSKTECLPMKDFDNAETYNKLRMANDETALRCLNIVGGIGAILQNIMQLAGIAVLVFQTNIWIAVAAIFVSIPAFVLDCKIGEKWHAIQQKRIEKMRFVDTLKETLINNNAIKEIRLFGISKILNDKVLNNQKEFNKENHKTRATIVFFNCLSGLAQNITTFFLKLWLITICISNSKSIGTITMLISSLDEFQAAVQGVLSQISSLYENSLYVEYIKEIQKMKPIEESELEELKGPIKTIVFDQVSFQYENSMIEALKNISFTLSTGKTYALVGFNGSGKTTLLKLIMKLYTPLKGEIYINGINIKKLSSKSICHQISAVFQDFIRYPFSVSENIDLREIERSDDVIASCKYADIHEAIMNLPQGYDTQLLKGWSGGTELSGGQWQKLAIARGLFKKASVLILDEPFSALDALAEEDIINKLKETKKDKLCIFVTHRYSSISMADEIIVLENGGVEEQGNHADLMKYNGLYHKLFQAQTEPLKELALSEILFDTPI